MGSYHYFGASTCTSLRLAMNGALILAKRIIACHFYSAKDITWPRYSYLNSILMSASAHVRISQGLGVNDAVDFDSMWGILANSLREINTKNASSLSFEELYRNAYKLVLKKRGETLYLRVKEFEEEWLATQVQPHILTVLSSTLILGNAGGLAINTINEQRAAGEKLLRALKQAWEDHNLCMNMTTDVLMYMVSTQR